LGKEGRTDQVTASEEVTPEDIAAWMLEQVNANPWLDQWRAVRSIGEEFGEEFTYENQNGNPAIDRRVLAAFKKLSEGTVIWDRGMFAWRLRTETDEPGRRQA
jgi:hypothetical protein